MTKLTYDRRLVPIAAVVTLAIAMSIVAYAGHVPPTIAAHGIDKILHAAMGFALTFCLGRALRGRFIFAACTVLVVLTADEYLQRFSAYRSSDWFDLLADLVGSSVAIAVGKRMALRR
jgi:VanZ family protein